MNCSYYPKYSHIVSHLNYLSRSLDSLSSKHENIILLGDFNSDMGDSTMIAFYKNCKLYNLEKSPTCFKNPENTLCIDLLLTNKPLSFLTTTFTGQDYLILVEW